MNLSQSSRNADPLADVLGVLDARATGTTRLEASGDWSLAFPALDRLKFVALLRGTAWIMVPDAAPLKITAGDCCLIGRTAYVVASDPAQPRRDGVPLYAAGNHLLRLQGDDMIAIGGGLSFAPGNGSFLLDRLPAFVHIPAGSPGSSAIATILALLDSETGQVGIGSAAVADRLAEILLVQAIRACAAAPGATDGWLGALLDPRIGRAMKEFHRDVARPWTVAELAAEAGMSRAAFSAAFTRRIGQPPLAYVRAWRMTRARIALASSDHSVSAVAASVGYTSQSAFGHAFRRSYGVAPRDSVT